MRGNPHPWRLMTALFAGVLLFSMGLQRLFSPAGDAVLEAVERRAAVVAAKKQESIPAPSYREAVAPRGPEATGDIPLRRGSCHGCHGES